jgi:hypothetical protein
MASGKPSPVLQFIHKIADDGACPYLADRELLQRFVRGDQSAFAELVERHGPAILGALLSDRKPHPSLYTHEQPASRSRLKLDCQNKLDAIGGFKFDDAMNNPG